ITQGPVPPSSLRIDTVPSSRLEFPQSCASAVARAFAIRVRWLSTDWVAPAFRIAKTKSDSTAGARNPLQESKRLRSTKRTKLGTLRDRPHTVEAFQDSP